MSDLGMLENMGFEKHVPEVHETFAMLELSRQVLQAMVLSGLPNIEDCVGK